MKLNIPAGKTANLDTTQRQSCDTISSGFGEGFNGPLLLVAEPRISTYKVTPEMLNNLVQDLQKHENISLVTALISFTDGGYLTITFNKLMQQTLGVYVPLRIIQPYSKSPFDLMRPIFMSHLFMRHLKK